MGRGDPPLSYPVLVVSAHFDDAVFSAGRFLVSCAGEAATLATVMTDGPGDAETAWDARSGFRTSGEAITERQAEDHHACRLLAVGCDHLGFADGQYGSPATVGDVTSAIVAAAGRVGAARLIGPLGICHPDHETVAAACRAAAARLRVPLIVYEDVPYRVEHPEVAVDAVRRLGYVPATVPQGSEETKAAAVGCYRSQLWAFPPATLMVPERFWRTR